MTLLTTTKGTSVAGQDYVAATQSVIAQLLAESFDLTGDEILIVNYKLRDLLSPIADADVVALPVMIRREMDDRSASTMLEERVSSELLGGKIVRQTQRQADVTDWAEALLDPVFTGFAVPAFDEARMRTGMVDLLRSLGIGDPDSPRYSLFLPADVLALTRSR